MSQSDYIKGVKCPKCHGKGKILIEHRDLTGSVKRVPFRRSSIKVCEFCRGEGYIYNKKLMMDKKKHFMII